MLLIKLLTKLWELSNSLKFIFPLLIPLSLFSEINILLIGDSNTHGVPFYENGWVYLLENDEDLKKYDLKFENYAFGYSTVSQCEQLLMQLLKHREYDILFYNCGLVDFLFHPDNLSVTEDCMRRTLGRCCKKIPYVFFGMINFTCWTIRKNIPITQINMAHTLFNKMVQEFPIIPYDFLTTDLLCHEKCNYGDWVHPNSEGSLIIHKEVKKRLQELLTEKF